MENGLEVLREALRKHPVWYVSLIGLDKKAKLYPLREVYEVNGAFYWPLKKSERRYGDLSVSKTVQLGIAEEDVFYCLSGTPVFTEENDILKQCVKEEDLTPWIAFTLDKAVLTVSDGEKETKYSIARAEGALYGTTIKKDPELRDRIRKRIEERAQLSAENTEMQKVLDGALLYLAQTAKELWPRMNILPLEMVLLYETYDEREAYVKKAAGKIGNVTLDKVEDITYYLSEDFWR